MYKLLKPLLFKLDPEAAHEFTTDLSKTYFQWPIVKHWLKQSFQLEDERLHRNCFGLHFKNPVGLAAGFDKNAELIDTFDKLGFGFIEIGTVTPKPQPGNPKPRLFRLPEHEALINRLGFNNHGVELIAKRLESRKSDIIVGGNIGKNKITPNEEAVNDYKICFETLFDLVDYFVVNVSSPNTPDLRQLQDKEPLTRLLSNLQEINQGKSSPKPLLLKIAPDLNPQQLDDIIQIVSNTQLDGLIATNTTIDRKKVADNPLAKEQGGLSGKPVSDKSNEVLAYLRASFPKSFPIIGVGGIVHPQDAVKKIKLGANLVQVYTGLVYRGPKLIKSINQELLKTKATV